jgi:hypothetical protein
MTSAITGWFTGEEPNELCPTLSFQSRVYGFATCCLLGAFMGVLSWSCILRREWTLFGIFITGSNLLNIGGSMFFAGPVKQFKNMFAETRWMATTVYVLAMVLTIVAAALHKPPFVIVMCVIQYFAMVWYGLSYIPYARTLVKNCISSAV